jgi:hypothetical protein
VAIAACSLTVLVAGCSASGVPGRGTSRQTSAVANAGHETLGSQYLEVADAGNDRLETDIDRLTGRDRNRLAAAQGDLRDATATERLFDRRVVAIAFPPEIEAIAETLSMVNQSRALLSADASMAQTLAALRRDETRIDAANAQVEVQVRRIRAALRLPPPSTS